MKKIIIFGASGHAKVVADIVNREGRSKIVGFITKADESSNPISGFNRLGGDDDLPAILREHNVDSGIIAVGDNFRRSAIYRSVMNQFPGFNFVTAIHPGAWIAPDSNIGPGTVVMAGAIINSGSHVGSCCIVNTHASLDHDSRMEDFSSLAPGVVTGGNVEVGHCSAVGIGSVIKHGISIGEHAVVGAGSLVMKDVPPLSVCYGHPCKLVRMREAGTGYL